MTQVYHIVRFGLLLLIVFFLGRITAPDYNQDLVKKNQEMNTELLKLKAMKECE